MTTLRGAWKLLSLRFVLQQIALALVVMGLFVVWLRIPDSHAAYVMLTVLLGLFLVALAAGGETWLLLRLAGRENTRARLIRGGVALLVAAALGLAWLYWVEHLSSSDGLRAGYLNSQMPRGLRDWFSYQHLMAGLAFGWSLLEMLGLGLVLAIAFALATSEAPVASIKASLRSTTYWVVLLLSEFAVAPLASLLLQWKPGHGLWIESVSLLLRLLAVLLLCGCALSFVLAILAKRVRDSDVLMQSKPERPS